MPTQRKAAKTRATPRSVKESSEVPNHVVEPDRDLWFAMERFFVDIDSLGDAVEIVLPVLQQQDATRRAEFERAIEKLQSLTAAYKKSKSPKRSESRHLAAIVRTAQQISTTTMRLDRATTMFLGTSLVGLMSRLDEYTATLLRIVFRAKPDLLKGSQKTVGYDAVFEAKNVNELRDSFIEIEIDRLLRDSYREQMDYFDGKFKLGLRDYFAPIKDFVEIAERRNLLVHTGGTITPQYLKACKAEGVDLSGAKQGQSLLADAAYLSHAGDVLFEYGLRIGQGMLRRAFPEKLEEIDRDLVLHGVSLLQEERWKRARLLFEFACSLPEKLTADEASRRIFLVNHALALDGQGKFDDACKLVESLDWSSSHPKFHVVLATLRRQYAEAAHLMLRTSIEDIPESSYREWPAFRNFRKTIEFQTAFRKVFKKDYIPELDNDLLNAPK